MDDREGETIGLPMALEASGPRPSLERIDNEAAFVSQLIAARAHLAPQQARRRETPQTAVGAYASSASMGVKRMPAGFRKTVLA